MVTKQKRGFKRKHLAKLFYKSGFTKGVEVGVCHGKYSKTLCEENPDLKLVSVDPYVEVYGDPRTIRIGNKEQQGLFEEATEMLAPFNCEIWRTTSLEAVRDFPYESIDFVYIDGSHEFDYVMADIIEWGKRVKKGGIISGHDYNKTYVDVRKAVETYAWAHKVGQINLTWDNTPSWWFKRTW